MYEWIFQLLSEVGMERAAAFFAYVLTLVALAAICFALCLLARGVTVRIAKTVVRRTKSRWDDIFLENRVFHRASAAVAPAVIALFADGMPQYGGLVSKLGQVAGVLVLLMIIEAVIRSANAIYRLYEISKTRPIRGVLQVAQVAAYIVGGIVIVAVLAGQSPMALLGGIGAMTAVTSLIFKDAILGFVAGIQLTGNDMIRIGDWVEIPGGNANGTVIDLSMTTVKVENFDKTITAVPAYTLVSSAFINWRGMLASGGRRIKRAVHIDAADVHLCDGAMIERFRRMELLREYIDAKLAELEEHNRREGVDLTEPVNGRRITNVGTFRAYILAYLRRHPGIRQDMSCMVRQLSPDDRGLPLEIYAFTDTTAWEEYEGIQSDIFDHLYAVAPEFGLRIYQRPSSADLRALAAPPGGDPPTE